MHVCSERKRVIKMETWTFIPLALVVYITAGFPVLYLVNLTLIFFWIMTVIDIFRWLVNVVQTAVFPVVNAIRKCFVFLLGKIFKVVIVYKSIEMYSVQQI